MRSTAEICAQFGRGQFIGAFGDKKDKLTGYLSMENYIADKLVQYLLAEILSRQQVAAATYTNPAKNRPGFYFLSIYGNQDSPNLSDASIDRYWDRSLQGLEGV